MPVSSPAWQPCWGEHDLCWLAGLSDAFLQPCVLIFLITHQLVFNLLTTPFKTQALQVSISLIQGLPLSQFAAPCWLLSVSPLCVTVNTSLCFDVKGSVCNLQLSVTAGACFYERGIKSHQERLQDVEQHFLVALWILNIYKVSLKGRGAKKSRKLVTIFFYYFRMHFIPNVHSTNTL